MNKPQINYPFSAIVGQESLKLALLLCAIDPGIGGVLIEGPRGTAKSTSARALAELLPNGNLVTLPLGTSEERLLGSLDLQQVLSSGDVNFKPGLLHQAHDGVLYVDEVNLLSDHLVDLLLDVAASGINRIERDGVSHQHAARFVLIGTMNPDEGELRPQLLDRFGLCVRLEPEIPLEQRMDIMANRLAFEHDPQAFSIQCRAQQDQIIENCLLARRILPEIAFDNTMKRRIAERCVTENVDGIRADLTLLKAARAHAAFNGRQSIEPDDIDKVAEFALVHRRSDNNEKQTSGQGHAPRSADDSEVPPRAEADWGAVPPVPAAIGNRRNLNPENKKKA